MRIAFLFLVSTILSVLNARAQFMYIRTMTKYGGDGPQSALSVGRADALTNAYVLGTYPTTVTIGSSLTNTAAFPNFFVARFSNSLQVTNDPVPVFVAAPISDAPLANVRIGASFFPGLAGGILAGNFSGTNVSFGNLAVTNSAPGLSADVFIGKFNSTGSATWVNRMGGTGAEECGDLTVDVAGNSYLAGSFQSPTFSAGSTNLTKTNTSGSDSFLVKYSQTGSFVWARRGTFAKANEVAIGRAE